MAKNKYKEWLEPDNLLRLEAWARNGLTDEQIAHNMGINVSTLYKYKLEHKEIKESLKNGKEVIDIQVENALFKRAMGYNTDEVTEERNAEGEIIRHKTVTKEVAGDTTAQIFWLKNRKSAEWRDKQALEVTGSMAISSSETAKQIDDYLKDKGQRIKRP